MCDHLLVQNTTLNKQTADHTLAHKLMDIYIKRIERTDIDKTNYTQHDNLHIVMRFLLQAALWSWILVS